MTDRQTRERMATLSVVALSAVVVAAGYVMASQQAGATSGQSTATSPSPNVLPASTRAATAAPVRGLVAAPAPARRDVVRRSRAS